MPKTREIAADTMGGRLRAGRKLKNLTLEEIGKALGVSAQAVSQWEYGQASPTVDKLVVLVQMLELQIDQVLGLRSSGRDRLGELADRLEQMLEYLPTAQPAIIDIGVSRAVIDGVYVVRLKKGERAAILGRFVWPKI